MLNVVTKETHMPDTRTADRAARDVNINLRATRNQRSLIDRAAEALGKNRSDFMLEASCREAESVLLDRRYLVLDAETFGEFKAMLDLPPATNPRLRRLLAEKAPWDR
jgi:uncharacterized protein (DUF1778 family)